MDAKFLRKQIKNVLDETSKDILTEQVTQDIEKRLFETVNTHLVQMDKYFQNAVATMDKRAKAVQGFLVGQVTGKIQGDLFNASITLDAMIEVLAEAGFNIPDLAAKIDAKKPIIAERRTEEASQKMKADLEAKAAVAAAAEAPAQQSTT